MTKDQQIKQLKTNNAGLRMRVDEYIKATEDKKEVIAELHAEVDEGTGMNNRLNSTLNKARVHITSLKEVARFFRAQRDRVDAYLSATLDAIDRDNPPFMKQAGGELNLTSAIDPMPSVSKDRRPGINEPEEHFGYGDGGRGSSAYRDKTPHKDWEEF